VYGAVEPLTGHSLVLALLALNTQGFQLFLDHFVATDPANSHLLLLDNGAFHKPQALRLPPNLGLLFFPPNTPDLNPIERLWLDLKDWLACYQPTSLEELSELLCKRLTDYSPATLRSLTGFSYLLSAAQTVTVL
jgi:hypothetical protein